MLPAARWNGKEPLTNRRFVRRAAQCRFPIWLVLFFLLLISFPGCQTLSLPAIDPTGNRLFTAGTTTLISPHDPNNGYPSGTPAFQHPPEPPKCIQSGQKKLCSGCLSGKGCLFSKKKEADERGRCGQLLITPNKIVAPVGGEVIILAGVCGKDEYLVTNEPIEWMLSPDSVGQIVEVGDDAKGQRRSSWKSSSDPIVEKVGVDFARGRTSREASVITKGTASRDDDLAIRKGQTWVSLTSPTEGTTKVTVLAPESDVWDKRRQTATVYWVDASWDLPPPQTVLNSGAVYLQTKVMRYGGFDPAQGWIVRYRSLHPDYAMLVDSRSGMLVEVIDAIVNEQGIATVEVRQNQVAGNGTSISKNGTAYFEMEIIRPKNIEIRMPELPLAKGSTSVTWIAPELVLDAVGPGFANALQPLRYSIQVSNIGDKVAENVIVSAAIPAGMSVAESTYQPSRQTNNIMVWEVGALNSKTRFDVSFTLLPSASADVRVNFELQSSNGGAQRKEVATLIQQPSLTVRMVPTEGAGFQIPIGANAPFRIQLQNNGGQSLSNLQILIEMSGGLRHASSGQPSVIEGVDFIRPGEVRDLRLVVQAIREGDSEVQINVKAGTQTIGTDRQVIRVVPAQSIGTGGQALGNPNTQGDPLGPREGFNPSLNNGNLPGSGLPSGLPPANVLPNGGGLILPGSGANKNRYKNPSESSSRLSSSSSRIEESAGEGSRLALSIVPLTDRIKKGDIATYEIRVDSLSKQPDQKVALKLRLTKGVKVLAIKAIGLDYTVSDDGTMIELTPVQYFRPQDSFVYSLQLRHEQSGAGEIIGTVQSRAQTTPVTAQ